MEILIVHEQISQKHILEQCQVKPGDTVRGYVLTPTEKRSFSDCMIGTNKKSPFPCDLFDLDCCSDGDVDLEDYAHLQRIIRPRVKDSLTRTIDGKVWKPGQYKRTGCVLLVALDGEIVEMQELDSKGEYFLSLPENFLGIVKFID